jgi:hypothetical protein
MYLTMRSLIYSLSGLFLLGNVYAQTEPPSVPTVPEAAPGATVAKPPAKRTSLKYTPPKGVAGAVRLDGDGGSRGAGVILPSIYVLSPSGPALTTREQPSLFYYQSGPAPKGVSLHFKLTLIEPKQSKPMLKINVPVNPEQTGAGIRRIQLARQKISLKPGVAYTWSVALGPLAESGSQDVVATGAIQYKEPSAELKAALVANPGDKALVYAEHGVWYDALEELSNQLVAEPGNKAIAAQRAALLEQVGLKDAAAFAGK